MKQQDIDKKIGMPDVNAEWAKFEREVIGEVTQHKKRSLAPWAWGIGIAVSIAVVAGLFFFGNGSKVENEGSVAMAEGNKFEVPEEKDENDRNAEKTITDNIIDNTSENLLAEAEPSPEGKASIPMLVQDVTEDDFSLVEESPHFPGGDRAMVDFIKKNLRYPALAKVSDSEAQDSLQRHIARLDIVPNSSHLGANTMRLSGTSGQNGREKDSVLVMVDGEAMLMAKNQITTEENLEHFLKKDIESIMVYKDEDNKRPYVEKYGELAKNGVVYIKTKPTQRTYEYEWLANAAKEDASQGRIAGLGRDSLIIHFVSKTERPSLPYIWERDTVLVLVNGKEDKDFLRYLSSMSHGSMNNVYDYFFERNQLFLMQSLPSKEVQASSYDPSLFEGRDIRLVVDYLTKPFTSVSQLTPEQIKSRRLTYLRNKYCAGFSKNSNQDYYAPDLYDSPAKERLFGLTAAKCHSDYAGRNEYFGSIGSDKNGTYVPLIRDVVLTTHDDSWYENGEIWILKDDTHFNQVVDDIRQAATSAESSIIKGDSIVTLAFIYGGKVAEGQPNDLTGRYMQKRLYEKAKVNTFKFNPDVDAPSYWWAEVYYSTTSITSQRQLWMHLHSVDKLYTADCPEIIANSRKIEGIVLNEKDEPLTGATVFVGSIPTTETIQGRTDSTGHFELCLPYPNAPIQVSHIDYGTIRLSHPADTALTIRMKDMTSLKDVKVLPRVIKDMKALTDSE